MGDSTLSEHAVIMITRLRKSKLCHVACFETRTCLILSSILILSCAVKLLFKRMVELTHLSIKEATFVWWDCRQPTFGLIRVENVSLNELKHPN